MAHTDLKFCFLILHSEGTVSQVVHLGLSFHFISKIGRLFAKCSNIIF